MQDQRDRFVTRARLRADFERLGVRAGDVVMAHAAVSRVGRLLNGPDAVIGALTDAVSPTGAVVAYTDWDARYHELLDGDGRVPSRWRDSIPPFDRAASRASRDNGVLPEFMRTTPAALRSANPGASVAAIGTLASWIVEPHPLDYGYGPGTPLARVVEADGKVVMIGAPHDTMTVLHHAEHLADIPRKRVIRYEVPIATAAGVDWVWTEEFDTSQPVSPLLDALGADPFQLIVDAFLESGHGAVGLVGEAPTTIVSAAEIVAFAVSWFEATISQPSE